MAIPDDASSIASTLHRAFLEYEPLYTPEAFAATISSPDQIRPRLNEGPSWVALQDGVVVGTVSVASKGDALYIRSMAVDPATRGSGIGRELLKRVEEYAARRGFKRLYLSTTPFLSGAIRLYERCGFVRNDDGLDDLFGTPLFMMEKNLSEPAQGETMRRYLIDTFRYNDWANKQSLKLIHQMPQPDEAIRLFSHLITSQNKWMARINRDPNEPRIAWFESPFPLGELEARWEESLGAWLRFLERAPDDELDDELGDELAREVHYTAGDGNPYSSLIRDIALQLNYHSIHHRAQISLLARGQNLEPPFIDYIGYVRIKQ